MLCGTGQRLSSRQGQYLVPKYCAECMGLLNDHVVATVIDEKRSSLVLASYELIDYLPDSAPPVPYKTHRRLGFSLREAYQGCRCLMYVAMHCMSAARRLHRCAPTQEISTPEDALYCEQVVGHRVAHARPSVRHSAAVLVA